MYSQDVCVLLARACVCAAWLPSRLGDLWVNRNNVLATLFLRNNALARTAFGYSRVVGCRVQGAGYATANTGVLYVDAVSIRPSYNPLKAFRLETTNVVHTKKGGRTETKGQERKLKVSCFAVYTEGQASAQ